MTRQLSDPIVIRRDGVIRFIDWDYGMRPVRQPDPAYIEGWATRRANQRAADPLRGDGGSAF